VDYIFETNQLASDYCPPPVAVTGYRNADLEPTPTAVAAINYLQTHTKLLQGSTDKTVLDVFFQEVGVRFFGSICKHIKTLKINPDGAIRLISYPLSYSQGLILGTLIYIIHTHRRYDNSRSCHTLSH